MKYTREELIKIIQDNLAVVFTIPQPIENKKIIELKEIEALNKERTYFKNNFTFAIEKIEKAFIEAGMEKEYKEIETKCGGSLFNFLMVQADSSSPTDYVEQTQRKSTLLYYFMSAINEKIPVSEEHEEQDMKYSINEYLKGFIYDQEFGDSKYLNESAMTRIKTLYQFYGLPLEEDTITEINNQYQEQFLDFISKGMHGFDKYAQYTPSILGTFIYEDIYSKIRIKTTTDKEKFNEKIETIKTLIREYEELQSKEEKSLEEIKKIQAKKEEIESILNGVKI